MKLGQELSAVTTAKHIFSGSVVIAYEREKKGGKSKWRSAFSISWVLVDYPRTKTPTSILSYGQLIFHLNALFYNQAKTEQSQYGRYQTHGELK